MSSADAADDSDSFCSEDDDKLTELALSMNVGNSVTSNDRSGSLKRESFLATKNTVVFNQKKVEFLEDPESERTYGRRIALSLMKKAWYNPQSKQKNGGSGGNDEEEAGHALPSLAKAWAYFEHFTLPRHIYKEETGRRFGRQLEYARAGEDSVRTKLYSPIWTHINQMGDFGIGVGLYFSALRAMILMSILAGCISIPNILYYSSDSYSKTDTLQVGSFGTTKNLTISGLGGSVSMTVSTVRPGLETMLQGSAVCQDTSWVPCPTCTMQQFDKAQSRVLQSQQQDGLLFVLKNNCTAPPLMQGYVNLAAIVFLAIGYMFMSRNQSRMCVTFDEDEQTAQDYSVQIHNPPVDAYDPAEWKEFFNQFDGATVTCCSICVNNDILVKALVERRERYLQLTRMVPPGTSLDDNTVSLIAATCERDRGGLKYLIATILHPFNLRLDEAALYSRIVVLTSKIRGLCQLENKVSNVIITFEYEKHQRAVLNALDCGTISAKTNNANAFYQASHLFRRRQVLQVTEPEEPSTIRWQDLNAKYSKRFRTIIITAIITLVLNVFTSWIVQRVNKVFGYRGSAVTIALANIIFPGFCKIMTAIEPHKSESEYETSLLLKITFFRFINTAIVINVITQFPFYLEHSNEGLLPYVYTILFADIFISNAAQLLDPIGHFKRHILGPREITQDFMNKRFQGTTWHLAERYTNMSKVIFFSFYYCTLYPVGYFMCAAALLINFYADKFCVMRTWARAPRIGTSIGKINQIYIIPLTLLAMIIMSSYWWASWPFDNLCENGTIHEKYIGTYDFPTKTYQTLDGNETSYKYCHQSLIFHKDGKVTFPALSMWQQGGDKWMTKDQESITNIFGILSVVGSVLILLRFFWHSKKYIFGLFRGVYKEQGKDTGIAFSDVREISCYIPQVVSREFSYPLIVSCVEDVDTKLIEWKDPDKSHEYYNVMQDAREILHGEGRLELPPHVFSKVYHYPPDSKLNAPVFDGDGSKESITSSFGKSSTPTLAGDVSTIRMIGGSIRTSQAPSAPPFDGDGSSVRMIGGSCRTSKAPF